jgi:hypothetical protein
VRDALRRAADVTTDFLQAFADAWNRHGADAGLGDLCRMRTGGGARHFVCGDRCVSESTFTGTRRYGTRVEVNGRELLTFRDGRSR